VATNYSTKWVEAVSLSDVTWQQIIKFLWQNIVRRFVLSHTISDNGTNFVSKQVTSFCSKYKITHRFFILYYYEAMAKSKSTIALP